MFNDPDTLTVSLPDLDGAIVAIRKIADGRTVSRTLEDGTTVSSKPTLAQVLVFDGKTARSETTLVFPESLKEVIDRTPGYAIGQLSLEDHPKKAGWKLWQLLKIDGPVRDAAVAAFEVIA